MGAMVISDETIRGLKKVLKVLQEATANIDYQISLLRSYLVALVHSIVSEASAAASGSGGASASGNGSGSGSGSGSGMESTPPASPADANTNSSGEGVSSTASASGAGASRPVGMGGLVVSYVMTDLPGALAGVTREVVRTLRRVVDMLTRVAGM
jgi:hypothetical protein